MDNHSNNLFPVHPTAYDAPNYSLYLNEPKLLANMWERLSLMGDMFILVSLFVVVANFNFEIKQWSNRVFLILITYVLKPLRNLIRLKKNQYDDNI